MYTEGGGREAEEKLRQELGFADNEGVLPSLKPDDGSLL